MDVVNSSLLSNRVLPWRWALWIPGITLLACASLFALRRLSGALEQPLPATILLLSMAVASIAAWATVRAAEVSRALSWWLTCVAGTSIVVLGAALSLPGTSALALAVLWLSAATGFGVLVTDLLARDRPAPTSAVGIVHREEEMPHAENLVQPQVRDHECGQAEEWQRLSRLRTAAGDDRLEGWVRVPCTAGQRSEVVHLSFCPPFEKTPRLDVECLEGPNVRVKITQLLPYAARVELKLDRSPEEPVELLIGLLGRCSTSEDPLPVE